MILSYFFTSTEKRKSHECCAICDFFVNSRKDDYTALFNGKGNLLSIRPADDRSILVRSIDRRVDIAQTAQNLLVRMTIAVIRAAADDSVSRHDFPQENIGA